MREGWPAGKIKMVEVHGYSGIVGFMGERSDKQAEHKKVSVFSTMQPLWVSACAYFTNQLFEGQNDRLKKLVEIKSYNEIRYNIEYL